jgi:hypothetical protein
MAIVVGLVLRATHGVLLGSLTSSWTALGAYYGITALLFGGALTAHLSNYTTRQWLWRAPAFGAVEAAAEALMSLAFIRLWREPMGSSYAQMSDWWPLATAGLWWRLVAAIVYASLLAAVVQFVRVAFIPPEERQRMDAEGDRETTEIARESVEKALLQ